MAIYLYNSLTRKKEEFIPLSPPLVNMYTCGPTVYDESHIGHARSLYIFDLIRRYLEFRGYKVKFVRNITDIDDKIIKRSQELNLSWQEVVNKYLNSYEEDLKLLNIKRADFEPRATENIPEMIKNIERLINKGYAYITETGVYFDVDKFTSYGKLSHQKKEEMLEGVRIEPDEKKKNPLDFALWKTSKENEPFWESPWGKGRPGWHIECSTMAMKYLGESLDIHGGGIDLIFPHHENEIAQSESLTGNLFSKYWIHHGLLTIKGQKMAKSLGNFVSIKDIKERYPLDVLKLFFLSVHYSHPIDFSWEKLDEFNKARVHLLSIFDRIESIGLYYEDKIEDINFKEIDELKDEFLSSMDDDFNTAKALGSLFKIVNLIDKDMVNYKNNLKKIIYAKGILENFLELLGLSFEKRPFSNEILEKIKLREAFRKSKDFKRADQIREELKKEGILLEDTHDGTLYRRL